LVRIAKVLDFDAPTLDPAMKDASGYYDVEKRMSVLSDEEQHTF
jgi:hypothetical protein